LLQNPEDSRPYPYPQGNESDIREPDSFHPRFFIPLDTPFWSRVLLGANVLVFVAMIIFGFLIFRTWRGSEDLRVLLLFGAKSNQAILYGQVWRLFTSMFLHIGVIHLLFNLYALYILGPLVEGYFGHTRFLIIYFLSGLFASVSSFAFSPAISAGASGAIFGLIGATTVYFFRYRENFGRRGKAMLQNMVFVIVINLMFGLSMSNIDNWAHMGGLLSGALIGWGLLPRYRLPNVVRYGSQPMEEEPRPVQEASWVLICVALLVAAFQIAKLLGVPTL
jgi:membrane associated rhomboid family serine protease